ncbi:hypothetical protein E2C01_064796 [Portunus trituberculatus]|uniref:Uncharacterized protein n=1 Tax=Portunus trituberculatus TaxID=210409 RepID=A0A5B7HLT4_PORTR|nr:hypothetical protein [Portunus trituberculatus]
MNGITCGGRAGGMASELGEAGGWASGLCWGAKVAYPAEDAGPVTFQHSFALSVPPRCPYLAEAGQSCCRRANQRSPQDKVGTIRSF